MTRSWPVIMFLLMLAAPAVAEPAEQTRGPVALLRIDGVIGPATEDFIARGMIKARNSGAQLVVLQMDTPGGLDSSMRGIIKDMLASPIPVAAFVAPSGARAASAGTYILYASHIAAMAPGTNLGAATPVNFGGVAPEEPAEPASRHAGKKEPEEKGKTPGNQESMRAKQLNDASAYIRGLAQLRGRNVEWAEKAVRESVSLSATEAINQKVIDIVASDVPDLLKQLDGRRLEVNGVEQTLATDHANIEDIEADWRTKLLSVITEPSVAYILFLVGIYGLLFEFYSPGFLLPGVVGAISLLTALFAFQLLPVNYAGLGLLGLGIVFMLAEVFVPSFGALGIGGAIAFVLGSVMLMDTDLPGYSIPWTLIGSFALASLFFVLLVVGMALRAHRRPIVTGQEELIGLDGYLLEDADPEGFAFIRGENWRVRVAGQGALRKGEKVRVVGVRGLLLDVVSEQT